MDTMFDCLVPSDHTQSSTHRVLSIPKPLEKKKSKCWTCGICYFPHDNGHRYRPCTGVRLCLCTFASRTISSNLVDYLPEPYGTYARSTNSKYCRSQGDSKVEPNGPPGYDPVHPHQRPQPRSP